MLQKSQKFQDKTPTNCNENSRSSVNLSKDVASDVEGILHTALFMIDKWLSLRCHVQQSA